MEYLEWLRSLFLNYPAFKYAIILLGSAFGGEPGVIALAFLSAREFFPPAPFFLIGFLGIFLSDSLYFYLGRTQLARRIIEHRYTARTILVIIEAINRLSKGKHVTAFILAKFLVGTRAVIIAYVSRTGISFKKFMESNLPAILIWFFVVSAIGYLAGLGFTYISDVLENIYAGLGFLLVVILILFIAEALLKRAFVKTEEKIIGEEDVI